MLVDMDVREVRPCGMKLLAGGGMRRQGGAAAQPGCDAQPGLALEGRAR